MPWPFNRLEPAIQRAAIHDAHELRLRYGVNAELWCDLGLLLTRDPEKRRELESIRNALLDIPAT